MSNIVIQQRTRSLLKGHGLDRNQTVEFDENVPNLVRMLHVADALVALGFHAFPLRF